MSDSEATPNVRYVCSEYANIDANDVRVRIVTEDKEYADLFAQVPPFETLDNPKYKLLHRVDELTGPRQAPEEITHRRRRIDWIHEQIEEIRQPTKSEAPKEKKPRGRRAKTAKKPQSVEA